jgi:polysaccharide export outer membrane protein
VSSLLPSCYWAGHHWRFLSRQPKETIDLPDTLGVPRLRQELASRSAQKMPVEVWTAVDWNESQRRMRKEGAKPARDSYRVSPGDRIAIQVADEPGLSKSYYVRPDGAFSFPWITQEVGAEGMTVRELEDHLRQELLVVMKDPRVTVNLEQGPQQILSGNVVTPDFGNIMVFGEVGAGGISVGGISGRVLAFSGKETLLNVLSKAGGLSARANWRNVSIFRREADPDQEGAFKTLVIVSDMANFFKQADFEQNVQIKINDIVFVPTQPEYIGDAFKNDWNLVLGYLGGITSYDSFIRRLSDTGHIIPRATGNSEGDE